MSQHMIIGKPTYIVSTMEIEREVPDWLKHSYTNAQAIQRVRELHSEDDGECSECMKGLNIEGDYVFQPYPCPTIKALEGE